MEVFDGAEFHLPPFGNILNSNFQIPFISYFLFFQIIGYGIRRYTWTSYKGFKQYRLRNLTLCVVHSCISGIWSFVFTVTHPRVMFQETIHWYSSWAAQLPILSMGLFIIFRFSVQIWQIHWAWTNQHRFHTFYMSIAFVGGGFFFIVNVILFLRVLASDGYLGEFGRRHTAINRYIAFDNDLKQQSSKILSRFSKIKATNGRYKEQLKIFIFSAKFVLILILFLIFVVKRLNCLNEPSQQMIAAMVKIIKIQA
ncbi:unnamed protein product [Thelazia callipaeda]|uniref:TLC domain-containing protein n=1 Tax=Thelazia callipaeda TaxID=103827 RepID=A0A0N5D4S8_THECL|nr:unnamed protein product [Thelazia callipaeda]